MKTKDEVIEDFLEKLGGVSKDGFTVICNKCKSTDFELYDDTGWSEETGAWGDAGLKCKSCGNAMELVSM